MKASISARLHQQQYLFGILADMARRGPRSDTLTKVAAAQRLVDKGTSVNRACAQAGIAPKTFRDNGGRSSRGVGGGAINGRASGGVSTARDRATAAAMRDIDPQQGRGPSADIGTVGVGISVSSDGNLVLQVNGTDTDIDTSVVAAMCDSLPRGAEEMLISREGLLLVSRDDVGDLSFAYTDWSTGTDRRCTSGGDEFYDMVDGNSAEDG